MMKKTLKWVGIALVAVLVVIQFFPIDKNNPPMEEKNDFLTLTQPPAEVATLIQNACYDCHSHETKYPWYTNVAPVSWVIGHHIEEGREHLNFSKWGAYPADKADHKLEECAEEVGEGKMPMAGYVAMHGEAKMTKEQQKTLVAWFEGQRRHSAGGEQESSSHEEEEHHHHD